MMELPKKLQVANTPTPIERVGVLKDVPENIEIYIKRDDYTGVELSGNKIRKLEFIAKDALDKGESVLITCGGIQSNHCRATAALSARLGLKCHLVVSGSAPDNKGNNALDQIFGAQITYVPQKDFARYTDIMEDLKEDYAKRGQKARLIPVGASTPLGTLGYVSAFEEILDQEKALGLKFDTICTAVGSAGTYAGLWLGNLLHGAQKQIVGMNIYSRDVDYSALVNQIAGGAAEILGVPLPPSGEVVMQDYVHTGYGELSDENAAYLQAFAQEKGMILDPVYTGKAFYGLVEEIKNGNPHIFGKVLFIHTGGIFGALARKEVYL